MAKRKEEPARRETKADREARFMAARIAESNRLAQEYDATLDPRQREELDPKGPEYP